MIANYRHSLEETVLWIFFSVRTTGCAIYRELMSMINNKQLTKQRYKNALFIWVMSSLVVIGFINI